jgi:hypothetical protein
MATKIVLPRQGQKAGVVSNSVGPPRDLRHGEKPTRLVLADTG